MHQGLADVVRKALVHFRQSSFAATCRAGWHNWSVLRLQEQMRGMCKRKVESYLSQPATLR
ncbi:hypothetical protein DA2_0767 [Desulfovibrio sp. A2]|nr:hypothetical protein DA2_0767 [Desulfovibrio sp. A2]